MNLLKWVSIAFLGCTIASAPVFAKPGQGGGNPNVDCPEGSELLSKFNWEGGYVFEKPAGNESIVTILAGADAEQGDWTSTSTITYVVLKGSTGTHTYDLGAGAGSGSFDKTDLPLNGGGNHPDISNVKFCGGGDTPPPICEIDVYGVHDEGLNDSVFFKIDTSGSVIQLAETHDNHDIEALDLDWTTGDLYAASGDDPTEGNLAGQVYLVDKGTGAITALPSVTGFAEVSSLAFRPTDNTLWAWADGEGLITIDKGTGVGTSILATPQKIEGITWNLAGDVLYGSEESNLWSYTPATGDVALLCDNLPGSVEALETMPSGDLLFATHGDSSVLEAAIFDVESCTIVGGAAYADTPYTDVEGIAVTDCK